MSNLAVRAEVIKISRLLLLSDEEVAFLYTLSFESLQAYRQHAEAKLFSDDITLFKRLARASKLVPPGLVGMVGQHVFGPMLSARVAGELDYQRAVKVAMSVPVEYLADICLHLDPARTEAIIRNMPTRRIRDVALVLLSREEYITLGRFVGYLSDEALLVVIEAFEDEADLLMTGFFVEDKSRLDTIVRQLSDERLQKAILAAQDETRNLWAEAVALMAYVRIDLKRKLGNMVVEQERSVLDGLLTTAHEQQLWSDVLPVVSCMSTESQQKISELPALADPAVMGPILETAQNEQLWFALLPLIDAMPSTHVHTAARVLTSDLPPQALTEVLHETAHLNLWPGILPVFDAIEPDQATRVSDAMCDLSQQEIRQAVESADAHDLWQSLLPLAGHLPSEQLVQVAQVMAELPRESLNRIVAAALESGPELQATVLALRPLVPDEQRDTFDEIVKPLG